MTSTDTVADFLARGGRVTVCAPMPAMGDFRLPHDMRAKNGSTRKQPMAADAIAAIPTDLEHRRARLARKSPKPEEPSARVHHVARLVATGKNAAEIASALGVKVKSAQRLIRTARHAGLIAVPDVRPAPAATPRAERGERSPRNAIPPRAVAAAKAARKHKTLDDIAAALGVPKETAKRYLSLARRSGLDVSCRNCRDPHLDTKIIAAARKGGLSAKRIAREVVHCRDTYVVEVLTRAGIDITPQKTGFASKGEANGR